MSGEITDTWLVGVVAHDDALSSIRVHAGYLGVGPTSGKDHRLLVRLRFGDADAPGFPDADQSAALLADEEALVGRFGDAAVLVAVMTVPGFRDLVFATDDPDGARRLAESPDAPGGSLEDFAIAPDPSWSLYRSLFTDAVPADEDRRRIHDAAASHGESTPRCAVEHRFSFATLADADQAAAALRDAGIDVVFEASDDSAAEAPPRFVTVADEALTQIDMAQSRDVLAGFAVSWGGRYLGWSITEC